MPDSPKRWRILARLGRPGSVTAPRPGVGFARRLLVYISVLGSAAWFLAVASRPAATIWTLLSTWLLCVLIAIGVPAAVLLDRLTNTGVAMGVTTASTAMVVAGIRLDSGPLVVGSALFIISVAIGTALASLARGIPEGRHVAIAAGLFAASHLVLPVVQPTGQWLFADSFVSFAEDLRAGKIPNTERFRVGPYTYDSVCLTSSGSVVIWHSGDDFMGVPTVVVRQDGTLTNGGLGENNAGTFDCNRRRLQPG
ncbi:MAG: hypothetical protein GY701_17640 [Sulfitobacter sp.]|nr:hypothetical protein [Sulfitobacter sp.]